MKKTLFLCILMLIPISIHAETVQYTMKPGETIETVAEQFKIEPGSIWDLENNPNVLFFNLPEPKALATSTVEEESDFEPGDDLEMFKAEQEQINSELQQKIMLLQQLIELLTKMLELKK